MYDIGRSSDSTDRALQLMEEELIEMPPCLTPPGSPLTLGIFQWAERLSFCSLSPAGSGGIVEP